LALAIYGAGLPAFVLQKVLQPLYFAREDTRSPFRFALMSMLVNVVLAVGLSPLIGFAAAAVGTTLSGWVMVAQLWRGSRAMGEAVQIDARLKARMGRILLCSAMLGAYLLGASTYLRGALFDGSQRYAALAILCVSGLVFYGLVGLIFGAFKPSDFRAGLSRQR
ncbi:MAG: lipid II flippase MurJ, partial [Paracoccaceae bacterium]